MPYSGSANVNPKSIYPLDHFVVMTPKSMQFASAAPAAGFKLIPYPQEPDAAVEVASSTTVGENLSFKVSGQGTLENAQQESAQGSGEPEQSSGPQGSAQNAPRPGGGLGPPIDAPDPLQKYRWWILGGFAGALLLGGIYVASRQQSSARVLRRQKAVAAGSASAALDEEADDFEPAAAIPARPNGARSTSMLMEGIKEELFQLEVERKQGQISQADYDSAKAALDQTLDRALKREAQKA
jgi:hypothetical protein